MRPTMRFGILGPLEAWRDGEPVELGGTRLRLLLALLLVNAGQVVPSARLIDGLWGESAPAGAPNALQALVSRVRAALGPELVESRAGGAGRGRPGARGRAAESGAGTLARRAAR